VELWKSWHGYAGSRTLVSTTEVEIYNSCQGRKGEIYRHRGGGMWCSPQSVGSKLVRGNSIAIGATVFVGCSALYFSR
jgi:hypothetical protein